ncbi:MAG: terminase [Prevotella sp.]|nr:terminase [Prevotella sp.]
MTEKTIQDILDENKRRNEEIRREYNPLFGVGALGERFPLLLKPGGKELHLPIEMADFIVVSESLRAGSVSEYIAELTEKCPWKKPDEIRTQILGNLLYHWGHCDFEFWAASYVRIKNKGGGADVNFVLNRPQRRLVERFERMRHRNQPIRLILLKARQWGGSTCTQLYMAWLQLCRQEGLNSLIIAHQGIGSDEIRDMFTRMIQAYPLRMLYPPGKIRRGAKKIVRVGRAGGISRVPQRNCKIKIGTAERPDSCRGGDYNLVHLSEIGIWKATDGKKPEDIVRSACSGILLKPLTMIVMESTANGVGNYFHREYLAAKDSTSQFEPMFVSWYEIDQYSQAFNDEEERRAMAEKLFENRQDTRESSRRVSGAYLWRLWELGATLEAINWYVGERKKYSDQGQMAAEYPTDDLEAFAHSGRMVFARESVEKLREECRESNVCGILETPMESGLPVLSRIEFVREAGGALQIWEMPQAEETERFSDRYLAVMDIGGRSARADWTVISVFDRRRMADGGRPEIVAQWRGHGDMDIVAMEAAKLAAFYNEALLVVESNTAETRFPTSLFDADNMPYVMAQLRQVYTNLYVRRQSPEDIREGRPAKYGFHTNVSTKPLVIAELVRAVREGLYIERDVRALEEMLQYEQRPNGSYGAIAGCHDDILMTRAIGLYICFHEMETPRRILPRNYRNGYSGYLSEAFMS